jgi:hypothetical protein
MTIDPRNECVYCGHFHGRLCPNVKAYNYGDEGKLIRVEFFSPNDHVHPELLDAAKQILGVK